MAQKDLFAAVDTELPDVGENTTIAALREEAAHCTRCDLYKYATQMVFGEGPEDAKIVMVGEVPGDQEDLQGRPFVGPAGKLLDRAMEEAGIERRQVYVTNAVKHFKFERSGKKRIHKTPERTEIEACKWWLERELKVLKPELVVALGGTAGQSGLRSGGAGAGGARHDHGGPAGVPAPPHSSPLDDPAHPRRRGKAEGVCGAGAGPEEGSLIAAFGPSWFPSIPAPGEGGKVALRYSSTFFSATVVSALSR